MELSYPKEFIPGKKYHCMQLMSPLALQNGHKPDYYQNLLFHMYKDDDGVTLLVFEAENGEEHIFDAGFVNQQDMIIEGAYQPMYLNNSCIILEAK
jgi:hypothetical protein